MTTRALPRGIRNNNPGNIVRTQERWLGMSADQSADDRFVVFDSAEEGLRALMRLLVNYQERHQLRTLRTVLNRWAPSVGIDQNGRSYTQNTIGYIGHVSRLTRYDPDETIDLLDRDVNINVARAIVRHENGSPDPYGRPESWFDDATYSRAATLAGFKTHPHKPAIQSRNAIGVATATAGSAATLLWEQAHEIVAGAVPFLGPLATYLANDMIHGAAVAAVFIGLGLVGYAQWDERRKGVK